MFHRPLSNEEGLRENSAEVPGDTPRGYCMGAELGEVEDLSAGERLITVNYWVTHNLYP